MVCVFFSLHCVNMWLIDSVSLHVAHFSLSSYPLIWCQYPPIMWVPCIVLYRNCWTIGLIVFFRACFHMAAFVSISPVILFMAIRVSCRFLSVVLLSSCCFRSRIPLYAVACVRVGSFAPQMSNSSGMSRFSGSGYRLFAPCFASASLASLPGFPSCPLTHCMVVFADLCLIR